jgi:hypothetical protein
MRERDIQARTVGYARAKGALARKLDFGMGWPDFLFLHAGRVLFVEFKTPEGRLSAMQQHVHAQLRNSGFVVHTVRDVEAGILLIDTFLSPHQAPSGVYCAGITKTALDHLGHQIPKL